VLGAGGERAAVGSPAGGPAAQAGQPVCSQGGPQEVAVLVGSGPAGVLGGVGDGGMDRDRHPGLGVAADGGEHQPLLLHLVVVLGELLVDLPPRREGESEPLCGVADHPGGRRAGDAPLMVAAHQPRPAHGQRQDQGHGQAGRSRRSPGPAPSMAQEAVIGAGVLRRGRRLGGQGGPHQLFQVYRGSLQVSAWSTRRPARSLRSRASARLAVDLTVPTGIWSRRATSSSGRSSW
jgi:hypothetical protein